MHVDGHPIPDGLIRLIATGIWPKTQQDVNRQNLHPLVARERVTQLAPEESELVLLPPPFRTVEQLVRHGDDFWLWEQAAPSGLSFPLAIPIGDFGLGSDAPIVLDYRGDRMNPMVLRLCYGQTHADNRWVQMASTFDAFVDALDLWRSRR